MNRFFGTKKAAAPKATLSDALKNTDSRVETLDGKIHKLDLELAKYKDQLKKMRDGPAKNSIKQRALQVLKQKKLYEGQRDQMSQQSFNIGQADFAIESMKNTMTTVEAMKDANKVMKQQFKKVDINKVEEVQFDMEDMLDQANELQEIMGRSFGVGEEIDEDMLDAELEALNDEDLLNEGEASGEPSYLDEMNEKLPEVENTPLPAGSSSTAAEAQPVAEEKQRAFAW